MKKKYKPLLITLICLLLLGAGYLAYRQVASSKTNSANTVQQSEEGTPGSRPDSTNYDGPTEQESAAGDQQKEQIDKNGSSPNNEPPSTAEVAISDAAQYDDIIEVRGYITNVYADGTCKATFTKDGAPTVTTTSTAVKDARVIQCGANDTERSRFSQAGTWQMTLTYTSNTGITGTASRAVEIK